MNETNNNKNKFSKYLLALIGLTLVSLVRIGRAFLTPERGTGLFPLIGSAINYNNNNPQDVVNRQELKQTTTRGLQVLGFFAFLKAIVRHLRF